MIKKEDLEKFLKSLNKTLEEQKYNELSYKEKEDGVHFYAFYEDMYLGYIDDTIEIDWPDHIAEKVDEIKYHPITGCIEFKMKDSDGLVVCHKTAEAQLKKGFLIDEDVKVSSLVTGLFRIKEDKCNSYDAVMESLKENDTEVWTMVKLCEMTDLEPEDVCNLLSEDVVTDSFNFQVYGEYIDLGDNAVHSVLHESRNNGEYFFSDEACSAFQNLLDEGFGDIIGKLSKGVGKVVGKAIGLKNKAGYAASGAKRKVSDAGYGIKKGAKKAADKVKAAADKVKDSAKSVADKAKSEFKKGKDGDKEEKPKKKAKSTNQVIPSEWPKEVKVGYSVESVVQNDKGYVVTCKYESGATLSFTLSSKWQVRDNSGKTYLVEKDSAKDYKSKMKYWDEHQSPTNIKIANAEGDVLLSIKNFASFEKGLFNDVESNKSAILILVKLSKEMEQAMSEAAKVAIGDNSNEKEIEQACKDTQKLLKDPKADPKEIEAQIKKNKELMQNVSESLEEDIKDTLNDLASDLENHPNRESNKDEDDQQGTTSGGTDVIYGVPAAQAAKPNTDLKIDDHYKLVMYPQPASLENIIDPKRCKEVADYWVDYLKNGGDIAKKPTKLYITNEDLNARVSGKYYYINHRIFAEEFCKKITASPLDGKPNVGMVLTVPDLDKIPSIAAADAKVIVVAKEGAGVLENTDDIKVLEFSGDLSDVYNKDKLIAETYSVSFPDVEASITSKAKDYVKAALGFNSFSKKDLQESYIYQYISHQDKLDSNSSWKELTEKIDKTPALCGAYGFLAKEEYEPDGPTFISLILARWITSSLGYLLEGKEIDVLSNLELNLKDDVIEWAGKIRQNRAGTLKDKMDKITAKAAGLTITVDGNYSAEIDQQTANIMNQAMKNIKDVNKAQKKKKVETYKVINDDNVNILLSAFTSLIAENFINNDFSQILTLSEDKEYIMKGLEEFKSSAMNIFNKAVEHYNKCGIPVEVTTLGLPLKQKEAEKAFSSDEDQNDKEKTRSDDNEAVKKGDETSDTDKSKAETSGETGEKTSD